jgi:SAM-dependent methyltransferase
MLTCRVCDASGDHPRHLVREMMFGSREAFEYFECARCRSLQIVAVPSDLARHYPPGYLGERPSADAPPAAVGSAGTLAWLKRCRFAYAVRGKNLLGRLLQRWRPIDMPFSLEWFRHARLSLNPRMLDVGCGPGHLLAALRRQGLERVEGQDLFQAWFLPGLTVRREPLGELRGQYDLVMLHHSFEHMPDPVGTLANLKRLCAPRGTILLRVPVADCLAWRLYGVHWYQIDAPRHLVIPSARGMALLAARVGLKLVRVEYDSNEAQFGCSEQYARGVPLTDPRSFAHRDTDLFSDAEKQSFGARARAANEAGEGDQACFYLTA